MSPLLWGQSCDRPVDLRRPVEGIGPVDAFKRSWQLVRGHAWSVFGTLVVVFLIVILVGVVLGAIATPIGDGEAATYVAAIISSALTAPIFAIAVTVLYYDLAGGHAIPDPAAPASPPAAPPAG